MERLRRENERLRDELEAEFEGEGDVSSVVTPTVVATESVEVEVEVEVEASTSPAREPGAPAAAVDAEAEVETKEVETTTPARETVVVTPVEAAVREMDEVDERLDGFTMPPVEGDGFGVCALDPALEGHKGHLGHRFEKFKHLRAAIEEHEGGMEKFSRGYEKMGFTRTAEGITYREWAPNATAACLRGDFNGWDLGENGKWMTKDDYGVFSVFLPNNEDGSPAIPHGSRVKIHLQIPNGEPVDRIPARIQYAVQAPGEIPFDGVYWDPPKEDSYEFKYARPTLRASFAFTKRTSACRPPSQD